MLEEGNEVGRDGDELLGRHVHERGNRRIHLQEITAVTNRDAAADKAAFFVNLIVRLGDVVVLLLIRREVFDLVGDYTVLDGTIRSLDEAEFVDPGVGAKGVDQTDVRAFWCLNGADSPVVGRMHVPHLEPGAVSVQTARTESGKAAFVSQFGQGVDLVHELAELAAAKEVAYDGAEGLRIYQLGRSHGVHAHIKESHALLDQALRAGEAHAALVGQQLSHGAHSAAAQVVNVIKQALVGAQLEEVAHGADHIIGIKHAHVGVCL